MHSAYRCRAARCRVCLPPAAFASLRCRRRRRHIIRCLKRHDVTVLCCNHAAAATLPPPSGSAARDHVSASASYQARARSTAPSHGRTLRDTAPTRRAAPPHPRTRRSPSHRASSACGSCCSACCSCGGACTARACRPASWRCLRCACVGVRGGEWRKGAGDWHGSIRRGDGAAGGVSRAAGARQQHRIAWRCARVAAWAGASTATAQHGAAARRGIREVGRGRGARNRSGCRCGLVRGRRERARALQPREAPAVLQLPREGAGRA